MKRDFTQEDFEDFLKRSANSLRMKAPEKVWQNLSRELNKRRRRFIIGVGAFLLITTATGYFTINGSTKADASVQKKEQQITNLSSSFTNKKQATNTLPLQPNQQSGIEAKQASGAVKNADRITEYPLNLISLNNTTSVRTANNSDNQQVETSFTENNFRPTVVDSYTEFDEINKDKQTKVTQKDLTTSPALPMTIESVLNSFKAKNKKGKLEKQFYFTPTVSYRKLTENKSYLRTLDPAASAPSYFTALHSSVNNEVTHKPDLGFELGFTAKYALSDKLKIRSGIQFNINRYDVKAFSSPLAIATIALNNGPRVDSLSTISGYSNVNGYKSNWLQNFSFQVSVPIGVEYSFKGSDKMQFGIATTVQPTYVLGDRSYLITTDYKSYTQVPWLIRRWNVNTALETFVKYKNWQFGPQVRYQLLSSFISQYPVKENLFDFGLKVGVTLK
jgi:hypothetical protein